MVILKITILLLENGSTLSWLLKEQFENKFIVGGIFGL